MELTRENIQKIRDNCLNIARVEGLSHNWKRAYMRLFDALDCIDAMKARTELNNPLSNNWQDSRSDEKKEVKVKVRKVE